MVEIQETRFENQDCLQITNPDLSLWVTTQVGPRVLGLALPGGENLMVVLPGAEIPVEGAAAYQLRGGHRLWYAPERPETTYIADDLPLEIRSAADGLELIQPPDRPTGIQKSIRVTIPESGAAATLEHRLTNTGQKAFQLAPWAVTMLKPGGVGCLPLPSEPDDSHGLWPNRQLALWPYTDLDAEALELQNQAIFIRSGLAEKPLKIGAPNPLGWLAYSYKKALFVKYAAYQEGESYLDRGASNQIYCNPDLIELETLGPVVNLAPGDTTSHLETWRVFPSGGWPDDIKSIYKLAG